MASEAKFTPGPLQARCINLATKPWAVITPNGPHGDEIVAGYMTEADAHLYAASPELWEKGMAADTCLSLAHKYARELGKHDDAKHILEVQQALRAALARANGEKE